MASAGGVALLTFALIAIASALTPHGSFLAFCPLSGVLLARLVRTPPAHWIDTALGVGAAVAASAWLLPDRDLAQMAPYAALDVAAACAGAVVIRRLVPDVLSLGRVRDVAIFASVAAISTLADGLAASALHAGRMPTASAMVGGVWASDLLGVFAVAPALLTLRDARLRPTAANARLGIELLVLLAAIAAATYATYHAGAPIRLPRGFPALLLMWTAFRFGPRGSALGMMAMTLTMPWAAGSGRLATIPSLGANLPAELWELQGFLSLSFVTVLVLAALAEERAVLIERLEGEVRVLRGLLPICAHCKKIRDEADGWHPLEAYLQRHTEATFTHGICPTCLAAHYGELLDPGR